MNHYNEFDPNAAAWLRALIEEKLIPAGDVDERSITDVSATDLFGYTQCHFFAGIGGWSLALQLAGWPEDKEVWTGSCPCQPFSAAGKQLAESDERHLWPEFFRLIRECRPSAVFGEQVASKLGREWLSGVYADLEGVAYDVAGADLCAAGVGAPHIRQRLYWMAYTAGARRIGALKKPEGKARDEARLFVPGAGGAACRLADASNGGCSEHGQESRERQREGPHHSAECDCPGGMGNSYSPGCGEQCGPVSIPAEQPSAELRGDVGDSRVDNTVRIGRRALRDNDAEHDGIISHATCHACGLADVDGNGCDQGRERLPEAGNDGPFGNGFWSDSRVILCRDGRARRVSTEPSLFPLADGLSYKLARRGSLRPALLKGAGNAIVPQVAAEFIKAAAEVIKEVAS